MRAAMIAAKLERKAKAGLDAMGDWLRSEYQVLCGMRAGPGDPPSTPEDPPKMRTGVGQEQIDSWSVEGPGVRIGIRPHADRNEKHLIYHEQGTSFGIPGIRRRWLSRWVEYKTELRAIFRRHCR
jgi:hypothetical protein